jgi:hypothetical protein
MNVDQSDSAKCLAQQINYAVVEPASDFLTQLLVFLFEGLSTRA